MNLAKIIAALHPVGLVLGLGQDWQQHAGKNANNGNHHQKFDQGETPIIFQSKYFFVHFHFCLKVKLIDFNVHRKCIIPNHNRRKIMAQS